MNEERDFIEYLTADNLPITQIQINHSSSVGDGPRSFSLSLILDSSMDEQMSKIRNTPNEAL